MATVPPTPPDALEHTAMRRVARHLLPLLFALYVVSVLDRTNVGFAAPRMNRDLGFSAAVYGMGAGIFFVGYALLEVPSNLALARVGARRWIARIAITWGVLASATACVRDRESFYALRFLLGAAEAGYFPGVVYYLAQWFPEARRARALSAFMLGAPVASIVGGPLSGALLSLDGRLGLAGWQWLFLLVGVPAVVLGVLTLRYLPDRPDDARWLAPAERAWLRARLDAERPAGAAAAPSSFGRALRDPALWALAAPYVGAMLAGYAATFWAPTLVRDQLGLGDLGAGVVVGAIGLASGAAMLGNGRHSDRTGERVLHAAAPLFAAALGFAALALAFAAPGRPAVAVAGLALAMAGLYAFLPVFWCVPAGRLRGTAAAGGIALLNTAGSLGAFAGPNVLGVAKTATGSFAGGLLAVAALALAAGAATLRLGRAPRRERAAPSAAPGPA